MFHEFFVYDDIRLGIFLEFLFFAATSYEIQRNIFQQKNGAFFSETDLVGRSLRALFYKNSISCLQGGTRKTSFIGVK